ncbi:hypothetical protein CRG98_024989 [Punica granatum]|uniref:Reverse transcriptase domain-containing protein n=1 Tax=Punica granatum TaxID=22663 RepID=A0A2I0JEF9_PUNGR|nr:hypothetical protein CRG98_024989 [Punica granatum]
MRKMPIWVQLRKIPLQYFHPKGISYLASAIGKPLFMDRATALRSRLEYAKVCIELDVDKEIPEFLNVDLGNNRSAEVLVDIPWLPDKCDHCKVFGHQCNSSAEVPPVAEKTPNVQPAKENCHTVEATSPASPTTVEETRATETTSRHAGKARRRCIVTEKASPAVVTTLTDQNEFLGDLISEKGKVPLSFELGEDEEGRKGVTSSDDDREIATKVKEARPGAHRQPRSASKGVVQAILKVQGSRKSRLGKGEYMALVRRVWTEAQEGTPMEVLYKKLRSLKMHLKDFNRTEFGNVHTRINDLQSELAQVQATLLDSDCMPPELIKKEVDLRVKLLEAINREEKFLRQKSRVAWLKAGDQNTSFFHKAVKGRHARTTIRALYSTSGAKLEGVQEIKDEAINFYQGLLGKKDDCIGGISTSQLSPILKRKVPHLKRQMLMLPITDEEIKVALFSMGNDKSPGPDATQHISLNMLGKLFRKTSLMLCNTSSPKESFEERQGISPRCAIKIDLMKAFDSLSWEFILNSLEALDFPPCFLWWIKGCITSPYFSVAINGTLAGYFPGKRGVRQGDPISPYLFVIAMKVFSLIMDLAAAEDKVGYHPRCKTVSFWYDTWLPVGPLIKYCYRVLQCFPSLREHATVSAVLVEGQWHWPRSSDPQATCIRDLATALESSNQDRVLWTPQKSGQFSIANAWQCLRSRGPKVE